MRRLVTPLTLVFASVLSGCAPPLPELTAAEEETVRRCLEQAYKHESGSECEQRVTKPMEQAFLQKHPDFYDRLLAAVNDDVFHEGEWRLLAVDSGGDDSCADLVAWRWMLGTKLRVVVVNLGERTAEGLIRLSPELDALTTGEIVVFDDQLNQKEYSWSRAALDAHGLYVRLAKGAAHLFRVTM